MKRHSLFLLLIAFMLIGTAYLISVHDKFYSNFIK